MRKYDLLEHPNRGLARTFRYATDMCTRLSTRRLSTRLTRAATTRLLRRFPVKEELEQKQWIPLFQENTAGKRKKELPSWSNLCAMDDKRRKLLRLGRDTTREAAVLRLTLLSRTVQATTTPAGVSSQPLAGQCWRSSGWR